LARKVRNRRGNACAGDLAVEPLKGSGSTIKVEELQRVLGKSVFGVAARMNLGLDEWRVKEELKKVAN